MQQKNNFKVDDGVDIEKFLSDLGFVKINRFVWELQMCEKTLIYAWIWPESVWISGDLNEAKEFLYDICTQFCHKNCNIYK